MYDRNLSLQHQAINVFWDALCATPVPVPQCHLFTRKVQNAI